jgi:hypothetical protein
MMKKLLFPALILLTSTAYAGNFRKWFSNDQPAPPPVVAVPQPTAVVAPSVITPPVLAPVTVVPVLAGSTVIKLDSTQGLDSDGSGGWVTKANWQSTGNQIHLLRYVTNAKYGQKITENYDVQGKLSFVQMSGGFNTVNLKTHRLWPNSNDKNNVYENLPPKTTNTAFMFCENIAFKLIPGLSAYQSSHRALNFGLFTKMFDGQRHRIVRSMKFPSGVGQNDGWYAVTVDGQAMISVTNWQVSDSGHPAVPNVINIQVDISNGSQPADAFVHYFSPTVTVQ